MVGDLETRPLRYPGVYRLINRLVEVEDAAALRTPEVIVVAGVSIESAQATSDVKLEYLSLLGQEPEIAVHSSQAYVRYLLSHPLIDPVSGRVRGRTPDYAKDSLFLS